MARTPVAARRAGLLAAAMRVVAERGLAAASTRAIVAEAGMSLASFHYAFDSRDELLDELIAEVISREETAVLPQELAGRPMQELIEAGLTGYFEHLRSAPEYEQAMLELTQFAVRTRPEMAREQYAQYARIAEASLELAAAHSGTRWSLPLPTVARMLVAFTDGLTLAWLVDRDDEAAATLIRSAARALASLTEPA
ncbi:TetR/AcrR family transcriptional regulator [Microbacterium sp. ASV49]|uniref:TetR family transcriptional regulator n=1 Tax=Microbacterium candidum TaxID=3041922 RepID=A0ABT7MWX4_9MICO|nr:TetR family transcriptional regulator [Microbacterium sp. ASV49]MDL9978954.1 TetR family transcriptional regulator [Microbacterium sp. ASV49]